MKSRFFVGWVKPARNRWISYLNSTYVKQMFMKKQTFKGEPNKSIYDIVSVLTLYNGLSGYWYVVPVSLTPRSPKK